LFSNPAFRVAFPQESLAKLNLHEQRSRAVSTERDRGSGQVESALLTLQRCGLFVTGVTSR
jgi:hypothetical protein